nr:hypothetical protein [Tanacetum cinerariifolium]GFB71849.1 hypothetical protein [Tanacetum cinerariifolium]
MNRIATLQATLDNALVPSKKRLKIERCFMLDKNKCRVDTEVFREILQICPRILNQDFIAPPLEEDLVTFIQELGYSGRCNMLSAIHTDQMHQPMRTFVTIINSSRLLGRSLNSFTFLTGSTSLTGDNFLRSEATFLYFLTFLGGTIPVAKS